LIYTPKVLYVYKNIDFEEGAAKPPMIQQTITSCDNVQCFLVTEHYFDYFSDESGITLFDRAMLDLARVYENAVLIGAMAVSKYVQPPVEPRVTFDVDVILDVADFEDFINDALPPERVELLDTYFKTSDTVNHSLIHKSTGIYVDFLSAQSEPVRKQLVRHILENRDETTNILAMGAHQIRIVKPEFLVATKLNRYVKKPRSEKGLADRLDIVKLLKSYCGQSDLLNPETIKGLIHRRETRHLEEILEDASCDAEAEATAEA